MPACEVILGEGSPLYPEPILKVFGNVPHQLGEFHVIKELTKALPRAVAKLCKELAATKPKLGRGRHATPAARQRRRIEEKVGDLFQHRYLFAHTNRHRLRSERSYGRPELRTIRDIIIEIDRLPESMMIVSAPSSSAMMPLPRRQWLT